MGDTNIYNLETYKNINNSNISNSNIVITTQANDKFDIVLNNTFKVSHTYDGEGLTPPIRGINTTGNIFIKDQDDGYFKRFYVDNNEFFLEPLTDGTYYQPVRFIDTSNLQVDIEELSKDDSSDNALVFSNIYLANTAVINFLPTIQHPHDLTVITGFKQEGGELYYKNYGDMVWKPISTVSDGTSYLNDLDDVTLSTRVNNQVLMYDSGSSVFRNSNIVISTDSSPSLGGNLTVGSYNLTFNNDSLGLVDNTGNSIVSISNVNTTDQSRLVLQHSAAESPEITVEGSSSDIDLVISSKGNGDIDINSSNLDINSSNVNLTNLTNLSFSSGFIQKSINTITTLSSSIGSPTTISSGYNIILFNISGDDGNYYATLDNGLSGQAIDIIFDSTGSNNTVNLSFTSKVGTGTGLYDNLSFSTPGQSSSLIYLGSLGSRNRWQVTNTGALVS